VRRLKRLAVGLSAGVAAGASVTFALAMDLPPALTGVVAHRVSAPVVRLSPQSQPTTSRSVERLPWHDGAGRVASDRARSGGILANQSGGSGLRREGRVLAAARSSGAKSDLHCGVDGGRRGRHEAVSSRCRTFGPMGSAGWAAPARHPRAAGLPDLTQPPSPGIIPHAGQVNRFRACHRSDSPNRGGFLCADPDQLTQVPYLIQ